MIIQGTSIAHQDSSNLIGNKYRNPFKREKYEHIRQQKHKIQIDSVMIKYPMWEKVLHWVFGDEKD